MQEIRNNEQGRVAGTLTIRRFRDGKEVSVHGPFHNRVVSSDGYGRNLIARQLAGDATYALAIDSASLGDNSTAASDGQTDLLNPLVQDIPLTNASAVGSMVTVDVFIADANLPNDTYEEFGLFCDGRMLSRVVISPAYTKVSGEDTLFAYELNISA
ncbi:hypothetical protein [Parerythrobacter lacustris]|uniref:Uncharacterized protein n=1 Tax=Parerythrobacter lacustris TaxID=2969984 RepID=A0ABT1XP78_9SPHN|nr:hypothetical protein [Parerythrobacter lacustris]MCR2833473.1 hypothetical protein [Parerythrobacter lacustris]